ncbi:unnamed protein product [Anisakis simplex]|uniref:UBA domain-containing protein n=1 Tax=Anisakis simplex TaxID=6269 RepID=A0A0M3K5H1_ANISI|nr:unnamed protein product [Anisakis simplex]
MRSLTAIGELLLSKFFFDTPSVLISGVVLLYYARWIERRFGSKQFMNFIIINIIQSLILEILMFYLIHLLYGYNPSTMYFSLGPLALISALYINFVSEIPVVSYAQLFGIPFSIHNLPFVMYLQLLGVNRSSMIACVAGLLSGLCYRSLFLPIHNRFSFIPSFIAQFLQSTSNPIGWLINKFATFGENDKSGKILPVGATVERQRIDVIDDIERRLMLSQMQQLHRNQANDSDGVLQLPFLNRLFGNTGSDSSSSPSEDQIRQLMSMGFSDREMVIEALRQNRNDPSAAANQLLHQN